MYRMADSRSDQRGPFDGDGSAGTNLGNGTDGVGFTDENSDGMRF
jgi:hypothetical protein